MEPLRVSFEGQVRLQRSRCSRFTLYFTCVHLSARWDPKVVGAHHAPSHGDDGNERIAGSGPGRSPIEVGGQADDVSSVAKSNKLARTCPKRWLDGAATGAQRTQFQGARRRFTLTSSIFPSWTRGFDSRRPLQSNGAFHCAFHVCPGPWPAISSCLRVQSSRRDGSVPVCRGGAGRPAPLRSSQFPSRLSEGGDRSSSDEVGTPTSSM